MGTHPPYDASDSEPSPCGTAIRLRELLGVPGSDAIAFLAGVVPHHLHPLIHQLLAAPTEEVFAILREEAVLTYASLSITEKREFLRRVSSLFTADDLAQLGRLFEPPPDRSTNTNVNLEANTSRLHQALVPLTVLLLKNLGPELAERFVLVFEAQTDEAALAALAQLDAALRANPDRASAAADTPGHHLIFAAFSRILNHRHQRAVPPRSRVDRLKTRLALTREVIRGGILGGVLGLAVPPLLAAGWALTPILARTTALTPTELHDELLTRLLFVWRLCAR